MKNTLLLLCLMCISLTGFSISLTPSGSTSAGETNAAHTVSVESSNTPDAAINTGTINHCISGRSISARYAKLTPPVSTDVITVAFGTGFKHVDDPTEHHVIHLNAETAYTVDVEVSGTVIVYDSSYNLEATADFTVTLLAGTTLKTQEIDIAVSGTYHFNFTNLSSNPTSDGSRAIVVTGVSTL